MKIAKPLKNWDNIRTSSGFGWRKDPFTGQMKWHGGEDKAIDNALVYCSKDGVIHLVSRTYGEVYVDHQEGTEKIRTIYAHMRNIPAGLRSGLRIKQGDLVGYSDSVGRVTGAHLHFGVVLLSSLKAVDPNLYFEEDDDMVKLSNSEKELILKLRPDVAKAGVDVEEWYNKHGAHDFILLVDDSLSRLSKCNSKYDDIATRASKCAIDLGKADDRVRGLSSQLDASGVARKVLEEKIERLEGDFVSKVQAEVSKATKSLSDKLKTCRDKLKEISKIPEKKEEKKNIIDSILSWLEEIWRR